MLKAENFARHREEFCKAMGPGAVALLPAAPERPRNGDVVYPYRPSSDFFYLTGFEEPGAFCVLSTMEDSPSYTLFVRPKDLEREIWDGYRAGVEGAQRDYGADQAFPTGELTERLSKLVSGASKLYFDLGAYEASDRQFLELLRTLRGGERRGLKAAEAIVDPRFTLHELRLRKSAEEIAVMRRAAEITSIAHTACMKRAQPGVNERELAALLEYEFRKGGGSGPGYGSIVGGGAGATTLHYIENNKELRDGDLVLIDAGCEIGGYTADVTRTFPVSGAFSSAQRSTYELVLAVQESAIEKTRPGVSIDEIHDHCVRGLTEGLIDLGVLKGSVDENIEKKRYFDFYMHRTSHWLGMDVHDVGFYNSGEKARPLEEGMVITIEPGLYFRPDNDACPDEFRGIGIRIEDDILVTKDGYDNLSDGCPKSVSDIEAACASQS